MAPLRAATRNRLPDSAFAYPSKRAYPINTPSRARNALARAAQKGTSGTYQHVARKVRAKYGNAIASVGKQRGVTTRPGYKRGTRRGRR